MNKILAVAMWEYVEKVKSKAFLIGLFITPILMLAMGFLPMLFATQEDASTKVIGLIDPTGTIAVPLANRMEQLYRLPNGQPNYVIRQIGDVGGSTADLVAEAKRLSVSDQIEGFCLIGTNLAGDTVTAEYQSKSIGDIRLASRLEESFRSVVYSQRIAKLGLNTVESKELDFKVNLAQVKLSKEGEKEESGFERVFMSAFVFEMMMFLLIMLSGQLLVRSVIEEKSNRIIEILVSSCSPSEIMAGKILGLSGLGFTQVAFWGLIAFAISMQTGSMLFNPLHLSLLVVYFVLGYLFYAAVFIMAGAPLNSEQEAQQITSYLTMILIMPIVLAMPVMKEPGALWIKILSFVPLLTPTMMAMRIPIQMPEVWEFVVTICLMVCSIVVAMFAAGRVFRIGILSTGKSPSIPELIRWIKTG